jgi:WNK lysine deficient protein kinase
VYRAIDRDRGIEVAWNQIRVDQQADFEKLWKEITILQSLSHPNILVCHAAWVDEKQLHVAFITECMTSGTIRQYEHLLYCILAPHIPTQTQLTRPQE